MISESVICDYCGLSEISAGVVGWFKLERFGIDVSRFGEDWREKHFCSGECLSAYADGEFMAEFLISK